MEHWEGPVALKKKANLKSSIILCPRFPPGILNYGIDTGEEKEGCLTEYNIYNVKWFRTKLNVKYIQNYFDFHSYLVTLWIKFIVEMAKQIIDFLFPYCNMLINWTHRHASNAFFLNLFVYAHDKVKYSIITRSLFSRIYYK